MSLIKISRIRPVYAFLRGTGFTAGTPTALFRFAETVIELNRITKDSNTRVRVGEKGRYEFLFSLETNTINCGLQYGINGVFTTFATTAASITGTSFAYHSLILDLNRDDYFELKAVAAAGNVGTCICGNGSGLTTSAYPTITIKKL